jgi:predicted alpha/beta-fold hydrolase
MGGNVALKLACELGAEAPQWILGVAAVSPPIELGAASRAIDSGIVNIIYQQSFLRFLTGLVRRKAMQHPDRYDVTGLRRIRTLRAFDDRYIAPMFGFTGADDYYQRASAGPLLDALSIPALIIHAQDDSIIPTAAFDAWQRKRPRDVTFLITDRGGHTGFIGRSIPHEDRFWAENRIVEWLATRT